MFSSMIKKAMSTKTISFLIMGSMLPMTTACEDHEIAIGAAIIAAGAAVSSSSNRNRRYHRRDDYRRSRRHYDNRDSYRRDHHRRDRHERRRHRRNSHFNAFFAVAETDASPVQYRTLADTSSTLVEEATVQDYMKAYKLDESGAEKLKLAVEEADGGYLESLEDLGLNANDIKDLSTVYRVTDQNSIKKLAESLGQKVTATKSMLHKMAMYARDMRLEACEADPDHFDAICR